MFSVAAGGSVARYPFNAAAQGGGGPFVASPDNHLYTFFGKEGSTPVFTSLTYQGASIPLYTLSAAQGNPYVTFLSANGNFYGLTLMNNTTTAGIFQLTPAGSFSWVVPSFPTGTYGVYYNIGLIQAGNGKLYGTLPQGGGPTPARSTKLPWMGKIQTIHGFTQLNIGIPELLLEASDGMLYGTAQGRYMTGFNGYSSIFRLNPYTGAFTTLYNFTDPSQGECECYMIQGTDGKLYGEASFAGTCGGGTIFVLDAGLPPPEPLVSLFEPQSGPVGQQILLWGRACSAQPRSRSTAPQLRLSL